MKENLKTLRRKAAQAERSNRAFFKKLSKRPSGDLDDITHFFHELVFNKTDCLQCANCCRILGPRLTDQDIDRASKFLRLKPSFFTSEYLRMDEDGDYVFTQMPCPFLLEDNSCSIYKKRPKACREFPHTSRKKFYQLIQISVKNSYICPAVYEIIEKLKLHFSKTKI